MAKTPESETMEQRYLRASLNVLEPAPIPGCAMTRPEGYERPMVKTRTWEEGIEARVAALEAKLGVKPAWP